ncbi:MAG: DNA polymerase I [Clostridia bacterium]|nr:DNA polymerase I [Clostridia bacterium]
MEKLVLIDGNSLINRAFYAMPLLVTKNGEYTNAVYGFLNMFFKLTEDIKPDYVAVAFDVHAPTFRHGLFSEYKGTRKPMPEELRPQIPLLKKLLNLMNVKTVEQAGIEADDVIGTIAKSTKVLTHIITGDKDSFQLVDGETTVFFTRRGISDIDVYDKNNFKEKTGIDPIQIIDLKALMGDASDNIPGIIGVGEKTAKDLIVKYGSVDNLYCHIEDLTGKLKEKVENGKESAYLSKTLATINTNCDIDCDLSKMKYTAHFSDDVLKEFIKLEFKSLIQKKELFTDDPATEKPQRTEREDVKKRIVSDLEGFSETFGNEISLTVDKRNIDLFSDGTEYSFLIKENLIDDGINLKDVIVFLMPIINSDRTVIVYDKKRLMHFIRNTVGETLSKKTQDVSIMKYLLDFSSADQTLETIIEEYGFSADLPAYSLFTIYNTLKEKFDVESEKLYNDVELPLVDVLFNMENSGFKVDAKSLYELGAKYQSILKGLEEEIRNDVGEKDLNVNSPKQLGDVLFNKLKIGKGKKTKSGYSTSADVLEEFSDTHEVVKKILRYRQIQKLYSTYIEGLKPLIDKETGLIHTTFNQTVTATGRLSSSEPNLQNIPVREDEGRELRKFFVPKNDDRVLISADYSQIELRLLAAFSHCKPLIDAFNGGVDVHSQTASKVFGKDIDKVTSADRRNAKAVNFGIIYGISEYGLAKNIGTSAKVAKDYIDSYFKTYPEVRRYMDENVAFAKTNGYAKTLLGRRRYIRELKSANRNLQSFGERVAMNMPLQGSSADIIKIAMINVFNRLKKENLNSELILQVHDELIIDAKIDEKDKVIKILKEEMEGAVSLSVQLTVEVGCGKTWFDAK